MPDLSALFGTLPPLWMAAGLLALVLVIGVMAVRRHGSSGSLAVLFGIPALIVLAWSAWTFADHAIQRQRAEEREALDARALQLTAAAMAPGSPLACLDAGAGEAVEASCEPALFARPETVAAATAYVAARLRLLADSLDYARRADRAYADTLAQWRRRLEADRYGFVAYVLATRDGCASDACDGFALLRDASVVKANMDARTLENSIAQYAVRWPAYNASAGAQPPVASALPPALSGTPVTRSIDFPTAASIPPVSIMTEPPAAAAPKPGAPPAAAARPQ